MKEVANYFKLHDMPMVEKGRYPNAYGRSLTSVNFQRD